MRTAAVILAAGASVRFGSRKQDARLAGRRMVDIIAATAAAAGLDPVIAVIPPDFSVQPGLVAVVNADPDVGISRSLRLGIAALPGEAQAAMVLLGDEPLVEATTLRDVLVAGERGAPVVAARSGERIGPPVLLRREAFDLVERLVGDDGLGPLLRAMPELVTIDLRRPPLDVDTVADLDALRESWHDELDR
jgi:CTP:molybdopterin cytidylyltransferase MocA